MKQGNGKRIAAAIGLVLLVGLYVLTFVSAILARPEAPGLFIACVAMTVLVPVLLYLGIKMAEQRSGKKEGEMSVSELRAYNKRLKKGEDPEKLAKEIEERYQKPEDGNKN